MSENAMKKDSQDIRRLPWFGIPKILPYLHHGKAILFVMIACGAVSSLFDAVFPLFNRYVLDHYIAENTLDTLPVFIGLYLFVLILQTLVGGYSAYLAGKVEMNTNRDLRNAAFNHLQTLSFSYFNQNNVGYIHARVMSDTGRIGEMCSWYLMESVWSGAYILSVIVVMFMINARLACALLLVVPPAVLLISFFQNKLIHLNREVREINSNITSGFNEGITGARTIKTLVVEDKMNEDFDALTEKMRKTSILTGHYNALFTASVTLLSSICLAVVLWRGGKLTVENLMLVGTLSVFMNYALGMIEPLQNLISLYSGVIAIQVNIERFANLMNTQSDVADSPEVVEKYGDTFHPKRENWEDIVGDVEFRDVSFMYPDGNEMVLEHFNLKVPHGTNVAIVGETGAGKSTLVNLVCRFFEPTEGEVLIDGRNAKERSQLWLHSHIGYVLQTPHLFSGSVRDNLRYGNPEASDEEIMEAVRLVSAEHVIEKMDGGLDADVGEGGSMLSTGEKQLLSFARAILSDPAILVLDEATSSIDTVTEKAIQDAIDTVIQGRTSFVIAHRLSTIVDADVILVVKDGRIVEQGTHKELMKNKGYYHALYTRQFEEMAADMVS